MTDWKRSSFCSGGNCVEVNIFAGKVVQVRDSCCESGELLTFTRDEWEAFIRGVKAGEFDL